MVLKEITGKLLVFVCLLLVARDAFADNETPPEIKYGIRLASSPCDVSLSVLKESLGNDDLMVFEYTGNSYKPVEGMKRGKGYIVNERGILNTSAMCHPNDMLTEQISVAYGQGWNMIGNPYHKAVPFDFVLGAQLAQTNIAIYSLDGHKYKMENASGDMKPFFGYWVYFQEPVTLTFQPEYTVFPCEAEFACTRDVDCADGNILTVDTCKNPGTCAAACANPNGPWTEILQAPGRNLEMTITSDDELFVGWSKPPGIQARIWNGSFWMDLNAGNELFDDTITIQPAETYYPKVNSRNGNPVVFWGAPNQRNLFDYYAKEWDGNSWIGIGTDPNKYEIFTDVSLFENSVRFDSQGTPFITWYGGRVSDGRNIHVAEWNGDSWDELGQERAPGARHPIPDITFDSTGKPVIAFHSDHGLDILRWTGEEWQEIGSCYHTPNSFMHYEGVCSAFHLESDSKGNVYLSTSEFAEVDFNYYIHEIHLRRWTGDSWTEVGGGSASGSELTHPDDWCIIRSMDFDVNDNPVIGLDCGKYCYGGSSYNPFCSNNAIIVKKWNGSSWITLGEIVATNPMISLTRDPIPERPRVAVDSKGTIYLGYQTHDDPTWNNQMIHVVQWTPQRLE